MLIIYDYDDAADELPPARPSQRAGSPCPQTPAAFAKNHDHQHWLQNSIEMHYDALFCQGAQGHIQKRSWKDAKSNLRDIDHDPWMNRSHCP